MRNYPKSLMMAAITRRAPKRRTTGLTQLDGWHSWQEAVPGAYVLYPVRKLQNCKVLYFNFELAKEMGLIPNRIPNIMTKTLHKELLDTFAIQIINEYDQKQNVRYHPSVLKPNKFMATRYLQLQHADKTGRTSGDGRSIWNGEVEYAGQTWDVSSRGTGVTCLSPGAVEAQKPLKSGSTQFGYGCGMADIDELLGAAIMAEIFHNAGINTERVLCVIDSGGGNGIGVRAGKNLIRPAHLFLHLKQGQHGSLKKSANYLIDRQYRNGEWSFHSNSAQCYDLMLEEISGSFARFAAQLDRDYIFAWLDWDGDNVLANAGIIDYGSIRQFGLRHDEYRYDDVDRFSTSLNEQKAKARALVQTFAQLVDFLKTGKKKRLEQFKNHWSVTRFDRAFNNKIHDLFLTQIGLPQSAREQLIKEHSTLVERFFRAYSHLESQKTHRKIQRVPDGVNRPAIFNMRNILADLPQFILAAHDARDVELLPEEIFFDLILAQSAKGADRLPTKAILSKIKQFQLLYSLVIRKASGAASPTALLKKIVAQVSKAPKPERMTGDGLLYVVDEIWTKKRRGHIANQSVQALIDELILEHSPRADKQAAAQAEKSFFKDTGARRLYRTLLSLVDDNKESI